MRKRSSLSAFLIGILSFLAGTPVAWAASCPDGKGGNVPCYPLQYHGGPFLETFSIHPLYYGVWSAAEIAKEQAYLEGLAAYLSGKNAPTFQQPMLRQYGVEKVTVAAAKTASAGGATGTLSQKDVENIIAANQSSGNLEAYGPHRLILLLPGTGFTASGKNSACGDGGGCHNSESTSKFWAVVPKAQELVVVAHEVFESATDPAINNFDGWDEAVDQCDNAPNISLPAFDAPSAGLTFQIPPATDNTNGGACSVTGYTNLGELQDYEVTHDQFLNDYNTLYSQGWRLYILQGYVLSNGGVRYNAVWRPGVLNEKLLLAGSSEQFQSQESTLYAQGWSLYILQSFIIGSGQVLYNAVWRPAPPKDQVKEQVMAGVTLQQFQSSYSALNLENWRLYILQAYVTNSGEVRYNAVVHPGDLAEDDFLEANKVNYESEYATLNPDGWRLYIFQSFPTPGQQLYNGVWRHGTHNEKTLYGATYTTYRDEYNQIYPEGWRLYVLNSYVLPNGEVRYDAVWRQGTVDRPL